MKDAQKKEIVEKVRDSLRRIDAQLDSRTIGPAASEAIFLLTSLVAGLYELAGFETFDRGDLPTDSNLMPELDPGRLTLSEMADYVSSVDSLDELEQIRHAEEGGKDRKGAYALIDQRVDELTEDA